MEGGGKYHSTTLDTWTAHVGRERAFAGSWRERKSAAMAAGGKAHAEAATARARPAPPRTAVDGERFTKGAGGARDLAAEGREGQAFWKEGLVLTAAVAMPGDGCKWKQRRRGWTLSFSFGYGPPLSPPRAVRSSSQLGERSRAGDGWGIAISYWTTSSRPGHASRCD